MKIQEFSPSKNHNWRYKRFENINHYVIIWNGGYLCMSSWLYCLYILKQEIKRFSPPVVYHLRHSETKNIVLRNVVQGIKQCFQRNMCETKTDVYVSLYLHRCRWLMFRWCFVYHVRYPETANLRSKTGWTSVCLIRETLFIVSGWRRQMWKTILFCVSHLFSVFWRPFALGFSWAQVIYYLHVA